MKITNFLISFSTAILLSACGGGSNTSNTKTENVEEKPKDEIKETKKSYDLSEYYFNINALNENKISIDYKKEYFYKYSELKSEEIVEVFKKDETTDKINFYFFKGDTYIESEMNYSNFYSEFTLTKTELLKLDKGQNSPLKLKKNSKLGDVVTKDKREDGSIYTCTFEKYYKKINAKEKIKEYLNKDVNLDKVYNDVIELYCQDKEEENKLFLSKDIGLVLFLEKTKINGEVKYSYEYLINQEIKNK